MERNKKTFQKRASARDGIAKVALNKIKIVLCWAASEYFHARAGQLQ